MSEWPEAPVKLCTSVSKGGTYRRQATSGIFLHLIDRAVLQSTQSVCFQAPRGSFADEREVYAAASPALWSFRGGCHFAGIAQAWRPHFPRRKTVRNSCGFVGKP